MSQSTLPTLDAPAAAADPDRASEVLLDHVRGVRALEVPLARLLASWIRDGRHFESLVGSVTLFGHEHGLGAPETHRLIALGFLLEEHPEVEAPFLEAVLSLDNAALLHDIYSFPTAVREGEDWLKWAIETETAEFRRRVEKRIVEVAEGGPVVRVAMWISTETRRRFERARELASRKAGRLLSRSETLTHLVDDYLQRHDPLEKGACPKRRTTLVTSGGRVPESVKLDVRRRFGDRCCVEGCTNTAFLEVAHLVARALGGSNALDNLILLCRRHHEPFDAKMMFLAGRDTDRPWFIDRTGRRVGWLRTAQDPGP